MKIIQSTVQSTEFFVYIPQKQIIETDVDGIKFVINFDYPQSSEDYIHRIGRTGRSQSTGTSYAFFTKNNAKQSRALLQVLKEANQEINPKLEEFARTNRGGDFGNNNRRYGNVSRFGSGTFKKGSINVGNSGGVPRKFGNRFDDRSNGNSGFRREFNNGGGNNKMSNGYNSGQNPTKHTRFE